MQTKCVQRQCRICVPALQDTGTVEIEAQAVCPEDEVTLEQPPLQEQAQSAQEIVRLHSLDSINALMWPTSRHVSSAGSRSSHSSGHLHLFVDHASDRLHLYVDQPQPPQPLTFPRLRSTASINALVRPMSRPTSARNGGSYSEAAVEPEAAAKPASSTATTAVAVLKTLPSATAIDRLLWPGDEPNQQQPAVLAEDRPRSDTFGGLPLTLTAVGTAEAPLRSSATFRAQKQQSLLDRAAAKRALAALLAAAKASQIRGWSPRHRAISPVPSDHAEHTAAVAVATAARATSSLPSLEDIEALVPIEDSR